MQLMERHFGALEQSVRLVLLKAIILLRNRRQLSAEVAFPFFIRLLRCQDKGLRVLAFRHMLAGELPACTFVGLPAPISLYAAPNLQIHWARERALTCRTRTVSLPASCFAAACRLYAVRQACT